MPDNPAQGFLIAVGGLSGSGKSTLAARIVAAISKSQPIEWIRNDVVRKELWGVPVSETLPPEAYTAAFSKKTYVEVDSRIKSALEKGSLVIADGVFASEKKRSSLEVIAKETNSAFAGVWIDTSPDIMKARAQARLGTGDASDADEAVVSLQLTLDLGHIAWSRVKGDGTADETYDQAVAVLKAAGIEFQEKTMDNDKIYGMLAAQTVELPYETPEAQAEADKTNLELAGLARVFRGATDWAYRTYADHKPAPLQSGDLVKIFRTVTDGDVLWRDTVKYDYTDYHHGLQDGLPPQEWADMFSRMLPARLERDGKVIFGALEPFAETGTEGVIWSLQEYGKTGYDGLVVLKGGDSLTVYDNVRDGEVEWEGALDFAPEKIGNIGWTEIMRETRHMDTQKWLEMSWQNRPVVITPAP